MRQKGWVRKMSKTSWMPNTRFLSGGNANQKGFTIIEIALVLAVAALIFLVVFLAVPALQRNQRNDELKRHASLVAQAYINYMGNTGRKPKHSASGADDMMCYGSRQPSEHEKCVLDKYIDLPDDLSYLLGRNLSPGDRGLLTITDQYLPPNSFKIYGRASCESPSTVVGSTAMSVAVVFRLADGKLLYCIDAY